MADLNVAIVGAITAVGRELVPVLKERGFPLGELRLLGDEDEVGEELEAEGETFTVRKLEKAAFAGIDVVFVPPNSELPSELRAAAFAANAVVIDASGHSPGAPLVFPGLNDEVLGDIDEARGAAIAVPLSSSAQLGATLLPLEAKAGLARLEVVCLEAVSGFGIPGMEELSMQTVALLSGKEPERGVFPHRIAFNLIPHLGAFEKDGTSLRERRIARELGLLLGRELSELSVTCAVAPVFYGTTQFVTLATDRPLGAEAAREALRGGEETKVLDEPSEGIYPMPVLAVGDEALHVGRVRETGAGLSLISVADNLRWGTVVPMVRVAELLHDAGLL